MKFTDANGREWSGKLTLGTCLRLKEELGVDPMELPLDPERSLAVFSSLPKLTAMLWAVVGKEGELPLALYDALDAQALERARQELIKEIINFSQPGMSSELQALMQKSLDLQRLTLRRTVDAVTPEMIEQALSSPDVQAVLEKGLRSGALSSAAPESPESPTTAN